MIGIKHSDYHGHVHFFACFCADAYVIVFYPKILWFVELKEVVQCNSISSKPLKRLYWQVQFSFLLCWFHSETGHLKYILFRMHSYYQCGFFRLLILCAVNNFEGSVLFSDVKCVMNHLIRFKQVESVTVCTSFVVPGTTFGTCNQSSPSNFKGVELR